MRIHPDPDADGEIVTSEVVAVPLICGLEGVASDVAVAGVGTQYVRI